MSRLPFDRRPSLLLVAGCLAACGGLSAGGGGATGSEAGWSAATDDALARRLASEQLEGYALVRFSTVLHPNAAAARAARTPAKAGGGVDRVRVIADEGDVVKVGVELESRSTDASASYQLTLYVARAHLVPVLRVPLSETFEDGSGYAFQEGLPLRIDGKIRPEHPIPARLDAPLEQGHVALSYAPTEVEASSSFTTPGAELGCEYDRSPAARSNRDWDSPPPMRTYDVDKRRARARAEEDLYGPRLPAIDHDRLTCSLLTGEDAEGLALTVGGRAFAPLAAIDHPGNEGLRATRGRGQTVLIDLDYPRATVRALGSPAMLRPIGGSGRADFSHGPRGLAP